MKRRKYECNCWNLDPFPPRNTPAELLENPLEDQPTWSIDRMSLGLCVYITVFIPVKDFSCRPANSFELSSERSPRLGETPNSGRQRPGDWSSQLFYLLHGSLYHNCHSAGEMCSRLEQEKEGAGSSTLTRHLLWAWKDGVFLENIERIGLLGRFERCNVGRGNGSSSATQPWRVCGWIQNGCRRGVDSWRASWRVQPVNSYHHLWHDLT